MLGRIIRISALAAAFVLVLVFLPGCPTLEEEANGCDGFVEGEVYEIELQVDGDALYAVEAEQEGEDCDGDDDEAEEDDDDCDEAEDDEEIEITAQVTAIAEDLSSFELLGALTVELEGDADAEILVEDLAVGMWVEVEGELEGGVLEGEELEPADEEETEIEGAISYLTDSSFTIAGLVVTYDDTTEIECGGDDDDDDDGDDDDDEEDDD
jgi:hypothetical protein